MNVAHLPTDEHDVKIDSPRSVTMIGGVDCTSMGLTSSGGVQIMQPAESSPPLLLDISADRCSEALADDHPTSDQPCFFRVERTVNAEERHRGTLLEERWSDVVGELSLATHWCRSGTVSRESWAREAMEDAASATALACDLGGRVDHICHHHRLGGHRPIAERVSIGLADQRGSDLDSAGALDHFGPSES
nr:hypothetical protein CFP56_38791 [Quercus suber]